MFDFFKKHVFCLVSIRCLWFPLMFCVTSACMVRVKCVSSQCSSHACLSNLCWPSAVLLVWDLHCTRLVTGKDKGRDIFHGPYASVLTQDALSKRHWNTAALWCCSCGFWYFRLQYFFFQGCKVIVFVSLWKRPVPSIANYDWWTTYHIRTFNSLPAAVKCSCTRIMTL